MGTGRRLAVVMMAAMVMALGYLSLGCERRSRSSGTEAEAARKQSAVASMDPSSAEPDRHRHRIEPLPGAPIAKGMTVNEPVVFANLSVFPVYGIAHDTGPMTDLASALGEALAEVRELSDMPRGAEVRKLSFENRSASPLLVPGGSVLAGGFQDRMVVRDFVLEPGEVAQVAVFCTEKSRWRGIRHGDITEGRFRVLPTLAGSWLRATGELEAEQARVWKRVDQVNAAHCKTSYTGALAATLEDAALSKRRDALAARVVEYLHAQPMSENLVGMAYAVNGKVRSVRTFANGRLFARFQETLSRGAAFEAIARRSRAKKRSKGSETTRQEQVVSFVRGLLDEPQRAEDKPMGTLGKTIYLYGAEGYAAIAQRRRLQAHGEPVAIAASFIAKPDVDPLERRSACTL
jgi:hypothetical protein